MLTDSNREQAHSYNDSAEFRSGDLLELQIPDPMPQTLATAFELGDRALGRTRDAFAVFGQVAVTRRDVHDFQHVLGVGFPIGGHVQDAAGLELAEDQRGELGLNDPALVVTRLVPWV